MIGQLRGQLLHKAPPQLLIDVHGVGYEVEAPMSTFYQLGETGTEIRLLTHLVVRDDAHVLYGFASDQERQLFRLLIKVSGVGARLALGILSGISSDDFARCVERGDIAALTRLPGIGKKTAERLIVEMRDRLTVSSGGGVPGAPAVSSPNDEALQALVALGYRDADATRMIRQVAAPELDTEALIRKALQSTVKQ